MVNSYRDYVKSMQERFRLRAVSEEDENCIDESYKQGYVFTKACADHNLFKPELGKLLPLHERHKWFRSMTSSQALTVSVFGTLIQNQDLKIIAGLECDDGETLLSKGVLPASAIFEHPAVDLEKGKRKTQIDVFISGGSLRIAIECKLMEDKVGSCSESRDGKEADVYGQIPGFATCHRVRLNGARYWEFLKDISDIEPEGPWCSCPLKDPYQIARNVLAASLDPETSGLGGEGIALLLYDSNNPRFSPGGKADKIFFEFRNHLNDPSILKKASWQSFAKLIEEQGNRPEHSELLGYLSSKYGIDPRDVSNALR